VSFLVGLPRAWVTIHVPGTDVEGGRATYYAYPSDRLPPLPSDVTTLAFLSHAARHPQDSMARHCEWAEADLSAQTVANLLGNSQALPDDFSRFLDGDGLRDRLRSATGSYFDLAHSTVEVPGGRLLHLASDSQWVYHWLLYLSDSGDSAVVGTSFPAGFNLDDDEADFWRTQEWSCTLVADSFAEFAWRWWMDNEIFYRVHGEKSGLTAEQEVYVDGYGVGANPWRK
jgi:hypothetical protein